MCMVLDSNAFSPVFNKDNADHADFQPALAWLVSGKGKLVFGGKKYAQELRNAKRYLRIFVALEKAAKIVRVQDSAVDALQAEVEKLEPDKDFDDPHLIAIVRKSGCRLICANDKRAIPYLKDRKFYPGRCKKPKIYSSNKNSGLLQDKYIAEMSPSLKIGPTVTGISA